MRDVVKRLGRRMRAAGIQTMLVIPEDLNPREAYGRAVTILADRDARSYVDAIAYHLYTVNFYLIGGPPADLLAMKRLGDSYGVPVWMTEFGDSTAFKDHAGSLRWRRSATA
jgi:O-glycosyl hydrolase